MADLLAKLPDTALEQQSGVHSRIQLTDSNDQIVYQWGRYEPADDAQPLAERGLSEPLSSWRLKYFVAEEGFAALAQRSIYFNLFTGLAVAGMGLLALAVYWYRESSRELREAATRVNFVNQVSHELKTPLTNIRMYAELLERDLATHDNQDDAKSAQRVKVIVAESTRLSRLIGNVLTFARGSRQSLTLKRRQGVIDPLIASVLESFEPTLKQRQIEVTFRAEAAREVMFDFDAVEQILVNLISNVEKYAAEGKHLEIVSRQAADTTTIRIADYGPGIRGKERNRVFEPFYRVSDRLEGAAGAGIGLSIARSLAQLHGGDLLLLASDRGAVLEVTLQTPAM
jgi:signal transduction histidine kinase